MAFNSITFVLFFVLFFFIYWVINNKSNHTIRNVFTLVSSYLFYCFWDWRFLGLIVLSSTVDYIIGQQLGKETHNSKRKTLLIISIATNLGILGFFKYYNFFIESLVDFFDLFSISINSSTLEIILPVGISFYTFQTLSYTIDVYRKKIAPSENIISFFTFVSFFPQLIAGPIERASHLLKQFNEKKVFDYHLCIAGLRLILWGFFKKIVLADNFGVLADNIFNVGASPSGLTILFGTVFFAIQIYADFSGYSDIAIGTSKMLGYDLMTNFKTPYFSKSFGNFWERWHISLSTWFKDYVYIPLGGNKKSSIRTYLNITITFLLSGLWHGANATFVIWGALHSIALIIEKRIKLNFPKWISLPIVISLTILFWLPFRAENYSHLNSLIHSILNFKEYNLNSIQNLIADFSVVRFYCLAGILFLFIIVEYNMKLSDFNNWIKQKSKTFQISTYYILTLIILLIGNFSVKPSFIYFQF